MSCGAPFDGGLGQEKRFPAYLPYVTGLGLLALILLVLTATGVLKLGGGSGNDRLRVSGSSAPPGTQDIAAIPPQSLSVTGKNGEPAVAMTDQRMPEDVRRWLEHLKRVDRMRESANSDLVADMVKTMVAVKPATMTDEEDVAAAEARRKDTADHAIKDVDQIFSRLTQEFQKLPPPEECRPIADRYSQLLLGTRLMLSEILAAMQAGDIRALESKKGTSYGRIDNQAEEANGLIDGLCKKYKEPNNYSVFVDKAGSLGLGMGADMTPDTAEFAKIIDKLLKDSYGN
jgi:hypothetical protein